MDNITLSQVNSALEFIDMEYQGAVRGQNMYGAENCGIIAAILLKYKMKLQEKKSDISYGCPFDEDIYKPHNT